MYKLHAQLNSIILKTTFVIIRLKEQKTFKQAGAPRQNIHLQVSL